MALIDSKYQSKTWKNKKASFKQKMEAWDLAYLYDDSDILLSIKADIL